MTAFGRELARLMEVRGLGVRELARRVPCNPGHISNLRTGKARASPELAAGLDRALDAGGRLAALTPTSAHIQPRPSASEIPTTDDEIAALELSRRAQASDLGGSVLERLELAVDDLATAYPGTAPAELLGGVRTHLGYTRHLFDARATLTQRRRLLATGGWLSLLAATCLIDLHRDHAAVAYLRTAAQLAHETEHAEITAWCLETQAWQVLTAGHYRRAAEIARAAQRAAPRGGSALIQATAQEGRAWARLGAAVETRATLARMEKLVSPLPPPDRPEHHYRYDPPKAEIYVATTLSWLGDPAAERLARRVLAEIDGPGQWPPRPRRVALARLDLALALTATGKHDEAATVTAAAIGSRWLAPVDGRRVREVINAIAERGVPAASDLGEAYEDAFPRKGARRTHPSKKPASSRASLSSPPPPCIATKTHRRRLQPR